MTGGFDAKTGPQGMLSGSRVRTEQPKSRLMHHLSLNIRFSSVLANDFFQLVAVSENGAKLASKNSPRTSIVHFCTVSQYLFNTYFTKALRIEGVKCCTACKAL